MRTDVGIRRKRTQLPDEVAAYVRELIFSGQVRPGDFLRMEPIAQAVGVSNTPVREGLLALASEGFVRLEPRRGFVVASFTPQDVRDIFWVQAQIAGELAARAAKLITREQLATLDDINADFHQAVAEGRTERVIDLGHQFHVVVNRSADSQRLSRMLEAVVNQLPREFYSTIEGRVAEGDACHPKLVEALRKRQVRNSRTIMSDHMMRSADHLIDMLESRGLWNRDQAG